MRLIARMVVTVASAIALGGGLTAPQARADDLPPSEIFKRVAPATVQVLADNQADGTGVIYDADQGLILTNDHVVAGQTALQVRIEDGSPVPVRVLGSDPCEDLAVLKLATPQEDLKQVEFGTSGDLNQGDEVTAIGYPLGAGDTSHEKAVLTTGVVQSPNVAETDQVSSPNLPSTVQHSATLNEGNSGGPLLNSNAELVGINSFSLTGIEGQYYSISSDHAKGLLQGLADGKSKNNPGWQGLVALSDPDFSSYFPSDDQAEAQKLQDRLTAKKIDGIFVGSVDSKSPASAANLGSGDVITDIKNTPVTTVAEVCGVLQSSAPGEKITVDGVYTAPGENNDGTTYAFGDAWTTDLTLKQ
ncbi:trypsin-like peptidase domain-containing protein [Streptomyces sp. NPDC048309]|uniref:S1C family serine protease n=1 Tax=unclassified Streptomyces TaxID=2593676 RepID=UPI0033C14174